MHYYGMGNPLDLKNPVYINLYAENVCEFLALLSPDLGTTTPPLLQRKSTWHVERIYNSPDGACSKTARNLGYAL